MYEVVSVRRRRKREALPPHKCAAVALAKGDCPGNAYGGAYCYLHAKYAAGLCAPPEDNLVPALAPATFPAWPLSLYPAGYVIEVRDAA
jgi:hypothetical protein